jgi:hypothetical protein
MNLGVRQEQGTSTGPAEFGEHVHPKREKWGLNRKRVRILTGKTRQCKYTTKRFTSGKEAIDTHALGLTDELSTPGWN